LSTVGGEDLAPKYLSSKLLKLLAADIALLEAFEALKAAFEALVDAADALKAAFEALVAAADAFKVLVEAFVEALKAFVFTCAARALVSVAKTGSAPKNSSALTAKFVGSCLLGGVGSNVILMVYP
jgi:hypothetical protein